VDTAEHHYETIWHVIRYAAHFTHWPTFWMGLLAFGVMYGLKWLNPRIPNVLVAVALTTVISWAFGFEKNQTVAVDQIEAPAVREAVARFNVTAQRIQALSGERTQVAKALDAARERQDAAARLDAEHDAGILNVGLERLKLEQAELRETLRLSLFRAVAGPGGQPRFHLREDLPPAAAHDGRTWRLKVGNRPMDPAALVMTGGGAVVGAIPKGLPALGFPRIDFKVMAQLFPYAAIISLLGFMEAISIAKAMAAKTGQRLDPNQELIGQGLANILGAVGKSYPTSGSFSRSAVNLQAGALTGLSSVFTSLMVVVALLFFTPLLYHLPQSVLAAVIMMAVIGLVNVSGFVHAWKAQWYDGAISVISFLATLAFAPHLDKGIMIGVVLSLGVFLYKSMRPTVVSLARAEDEALRCVQTHGLRECEYVALVRFDGPLFFANASYLEDKITAIMRSKKNLQHIIIVANGINDIDASGEEALSLLVDRVRSAGLDISLSGVNEAVMKVFRRTHLWAKIGDDHLFPTMEKAIDAVYVQTHRTARETVCPLVRACQLAESA
jgi:MFS superfamily sulfate permease-like transporter